MSNIEIKNEIKNFHIGEKIRDLRKHKRLTLQELADVTLLSKPLLSQVENELVTPPIGTLLKIAKALKVNIHFFFEEGNFSKKYQITRKGAFVSAEATSDQTTNDTLRPYTYNLLAQGIRHKNMEPFLIEVDNRKWDDKLFFKHDGDEEFIYVIEGEIELHYNDEVFKLSAGDSIYFDSGLPHGGVATGAGVAKALAVLYTKG